MKKSLSIILSLVLLVSSLVIPMSVSAGTALTAEAAYAQLNAAVNNLEPEPSRYSSIDNMSFYMQPSGSDIVINSSIESVVGSITNDDETTTEINAIKTRESNPTLEPNLGVSAIEVKNNYVVTQTSAGLHGNDLHAVRFHKNGSVKSDGSDRAAVRMNDIGYLVFYVKTARDIKLTYGSHNHSNQATIILSESSAISVKATGENYVPVIIDFNDIDWSSTFAPTYHAAGTAWISLIGIEEIAGEPADTITPEDGIVFGSMYYIPVDKNVRDFKYDLVITNNTDPSNGEVGSVTKKYTELSGEMIAAAEKIDNDNAYYTAESFANLQTAIANAKETYLASAGINEIKALLTSELEDAGTVEEIWRPTYNYDITDDANKQWCSSENAINDSAIDGYESLFGEYAAKQDSTHTSVSFIKKGLTGATNPNSLVDLSVYDDVWLYAYNTYSGTVSPTAVGIITTSSKTLALTVQSLSFGINRFEIFGAKPKDSNVPADESPTEDTKDESYIPAFNTENYNTIEEIIKDDTITDTKYWNTNRFHINHNFTNYSGASIIYGSILGLKSLDKTALDSANSLVDLVNFYDEYIKDKGLSNVENATVTFNVLKSYFTSVKNALNDDVVVTCTSDYTLSTALEGENITFTLEVKNGGAVTSVTYGGEDQVIVPTDGVYTITVDDAKTLEIKTTRDGYAPVDGILTVDSGATRDIIDHSTANNHPTWSQNKDTLNNKTETVVYQEPVVFYTDSLGTNRTTAKLMYPVENIVAVTSYTTIDGEFVKYYKDEDFTITEDGQMQLTATTGIPTNFALNEMKTGLLGSDGNYSVYNGGAKWTEELPKNQILVTYTYAKTWDGVDYNVPTYYNSLSTAYDKLSQGDTLDVLFIGDSISTGCNTSGQYGDFYTYKNNAVGGKTTLIGWRDYLGLDLSLENKPYWVNDSWDKQVVANLQKAYPNATIYATNRSVGSSASQWYFNHIDELLVTGELGDAHLEDTDLVFIGFGMNERWNSADTQNANTKNIIDYLRDKNPNVSIVLVSAFYPTFWDASTSTWSNYKLGEQEDGYFELAKQYKNIAVAPVNTAFANLLAVKEGVDYISNGINHPNDYGVNLYADTITSTLINSATVTAPNALDLLTQGIVDGTGSSEGKQTTAMYLFAKYDAPMYSGSKTANPRKIILDDGNVATVVSRTFYVATKSVYDGLPNKDDFGKASINGVQAVTSTTSQELGKYWRKTAISGTNNAETTFGVCIKNITKDRKDTAFAVRAKVEYQLGNGGHTFTIYSDIQTHEDFSAQGAYDVLKSYGKQPSFWFNLEYDDGSTDADNFFG